MDKFEALPVVKENLKFLIHQMRRGWDENTLIMTSTQGIHTYKLREREHAMIRTPRPVYLLDVDGTGRIAASAPQGELYLYREGAELKTIKVWSGDILHASRPIFSPDGDRLALGRSGKDRKKDIAFLVDPESGRPEERRKNVTHVAWNRKGGLAYSEGEGKDRRICVRNDGNVFYIPAPNLANYLAFSPDGNFLSWSSGKDAILYDIDRRKGKLVWNAGNEEKEDTAVRVAVTRDNRRAAIGTYCGSAILINLEDGREVFRSRKPKQADYVSGLVFLMDDKWLATTRMSGSLEIYEIPEG